MAIDYVLVGSRIRLCRKLQNMSMAVLAKKSNLAVGSLRHIENGAHNPSLLALYNLTNALNISMDYVLGRTVYPDNHRTYRTKLTGQQEAVIKDVLASIVPIIQEHL